jgi:hypothetical protein
LDNWNEEEYAKFKWSLSRNKNFEDCLRKYYFQYYDWRDWWIASEDGMKRIANTMRSLKSRAMWRGIIIHEVIRVILHNNRPQEIGCDYDQAEKILVRKMKNDWASSVDWLIVEDPKVFCGLMEHYYHMDYCNYQGYEEDLDIARTHIRALFDSGLLDEIKKTDVKLLELEENREILIETIPISLKLDLALESLNGKVSITDWKTGQAPQESVDGISRGGIVDDDLQLNLYAMYVSAQYKIPYNRISTQQIFLAEKKSISFKITPESVKVTNTKVLLSAREMKRLDGGKKSINQFPQTDDIHRCNLCNFRGICHKETYSYPRYWRKANG